MTAHSHAVIWIDHHEARIFHFNAQESEAVVVHPAHPVRHIHHKANSIGSGHAAEDQHFLHSVADAIAPAIHVLIVGPASAKTELVKHIDMHAHAMKRLIEGVEPMDHAADGEIVDHARKFFRADHQMAPRRN